MTSWALVYEEFVPEQEALREALCALGNGYFAARGAAPESEAGEIHYPGTYLAGGYNRLHTEISGRTVENEDLVNLPNWLPLSFRIRGGNWFNLHAVEILSYHQQLDLRQGVLSRTVRFRDHEGNQTRVSQRRLVHIRDFHLAALETVISAENWSGPLQVRSGLDGGVVNAGVERYQRLSNKHLQPLDAQAIGEDAVFLKVETSQSELGVALAARTRLYRRGARLNVQPRVIEKPDRVAQEFELELAEGEDVTIEKIVAMFSSRDHAISECGLAAKEAAADAGDFEELIESHVLVWDQLWRHFDLELEHAAGARENEAEMILRLHIFHLLQTASPAIKDLDTGIPARGLHGEAYRGHIFWDELFAFPILNLRMPEITRAVLMYRYRRLEAARAAAHAAGYRGAMYPWQSGSDGREESQTLHLNPRSGRWVPDNSRLQRHVNAAIAYNVWQYYQVTRDLEFLSAYGAEMILEIARFWASMVSFNPELDRYEIRGVMGPDEYHDAYPDAEEPGLDNNAYTNVMAAWVLCRALELPEVLAKERWRELRESIELRDDELQHWDEVSRKMRIAFHEDGIISQFEGYHELQELDWAAYREKYDDIQRLDRILEAEGDTPNRYRASKQADVLMLFYLFSSEELGELFERLGYPFHYDTIPKNIEYYIRRTSHGSTLSRVVHSWVLARSDRAASWRLFTQALQSDVGDIQGGTTAEGIHVGAMAGTVDILQRGHMGIETRRDLLWLNPSLPEELACIEMHIRFRGHSLTLIATKKRLTLRAGPSKAEPVRIGVREQTLTVAAGDTCEVEL